MKNYIYTLLLLILIVGCTREEDVSLEPLNSDLTEQQILLKETSKLLGKTLTDKNALNHLKGILKAKDLDEDQQIISFGLLFGDEKGLRKKESGLQKKYQQKAISYNFKEAFKNTYEKNKEEFSTINSLIETKKSTISAKTSTPSDFSSSLVDLLEDENLQIYFPYDPEFEDDDKSINEFAISYEPLELADSNVAWSFNVGNENIASTSVIDNDYLDDNPVFVIGKIDNCDLNNAPANLCRYVDLSASNFVPDPLPNGPVLLKYSVNHKDILEDDILTTNIPRIQINGTDYMGFGGTHQKLRFFRVSGDGKVTQNSDGSITAGPTDYLIGDFRCKRKFLKRKKRWLDINTELDPDWDMSENSQSLLVFSLHHLKTEASYETTVKSGFKLEGSVIKPSAEVSGTTKIKVSTGSAKFRANIELSRRQVLATITGPGTTGNQKEFDGINYNVKKIGIIDFYLEHYFTDLTD